MEKQLYPSCTFTTLISRGFSLNETNTFSALDHQVFNEHSGQGNGIGHASFDGQRAGTTYRGGRHHSMVDTNEKVILSWENVNVHVKPPERMCCRGPDPRVPWKHVLRNGKFL